MSRMGQIGHRLYAGEMDMDIVSSRKKWYIVSAVMVGISLLSLVFRGINPGIEFTGGAEFQAVSTNCTVDQAREAVSHSGATVASATQLGSGRVRVTTESVTNAQGEKTRIALANACGVQASAVDAQVVGPTWGGEITRKALMAMVWFLALLAIFLIFYFNWQMALAAIVALIHDVTITVGVYSILHFEVTPSTVIGVLTILGYSMYDTVVVFDKVRENTRGIFGQSRQTYAGAANLALNQTLVRSVNTSIVAILPVAAILFVGAGLLGAGTLKDLALALFVGTLVGTYSSIFLATPLLVDLMNRDPQVQALTKRVAARGSAPVRGKAPAPAGKKGSARRAPAQPAAVMVAEMPVDESDQAASAAASPEAPGAGGAEGVEPVTEIAGSEIAGSSQEEAMARARARRAAASGRQQPRRTSKAKRH